MLFDDADFLFQKDLASAHSAKITKNWFIANNITVLDWPFSLTGLNPIENVWDIVTRKMRDT